MTQYPVIDHDATPKGGGWLQNRRLKIALLLAVVEGLLVAVGVLEAWVAIILAILVLVVYFGWARERARPALRDASWVVAVWQSIVLLVPILVVIVGTLGDPWAIATVAGYASCTFTGGCATNGGTCTSCKGVDAPSQCPLAGIPNCTSNRPSCSAGLNGTAIGSAHVQCVP